MSAWRDRMLGGKPPGWPWKALAAELCAFTTIG